MGAGIKEAVRPAAAAGPRFRSPAEMQEVLDALFTEIDGDPVFGPRLRRANLPHRAVYPDLGLVLNISASSGFDHNLEWSFSDDIDREPALTLEMDSGVANRYLQGRENFGIAVARGAIRVSCTQAGAAMAFLPVSVEMIARYRAIVAADYPHLLID